MSRQGNRLDQTFLKLRDKGRTAFIPFITAGDPDTETTAAILSQLPKVGADIIELGIPFSDPMADGPAIQAASLRALRAGMTLEGVLEIVSHFRQDDDKTPIVLMGYVNPILAMGVDVFCARAAKAGVDGLIVVDEPPEESESLQQAATRENIALIRLIAPTSLDKRMNLLLRDATGFLYYVAVAGVTGTKSATDSEIEKALEHIHQVTDLPVAVGFGIKSRDQVAALAGKAEAVVVGSAIVDLIAKAGDKDMKRQEMTKSVISFVEMLASALK